MIAALAPDYFPGIEYCAVMASVERFVVVDSFQYSRQSFQNRARLRAPDGYQWISIPLIGGQFGKAIQDVRIDNTQNWAKKHEKALVYNYGKAPFFEHYASDVFDSIRSGSELLGSVTVDTVVLVHRLLDLESELIIGHMARRFAEGMPESPPVEELLFPENCQRSPYCAKHRHRIMRFEHPNYRQQFSGFESGMSVLDLLFGYGPAATGILRQGIRAGDSKT